MEGRFTVCHAVQSEREGLAGCFDSIDDAAMVLSYTPMGEDPSFKDKRIMLVGDPAVKVVHSIPRSLFRHTHFQ